MGVIREAFILTGPGDGARRVAGLPLLVRTILTLQQAGVERCVLVGDEAAGDDPRIRCRLDAVPTLVPPRDASVRLVVGAGAVIDRALVQDLSQRAIADEALEVEAHGARVRVAPGPLVVGNGGRRLRPSRGTLRPATTPPAALEREMLRRLENPRDGYVDRLLNRRLSRPLTRLLLRTRVSPNVVTVAGMLIGIAGGVLFAWPGAETTVLAIGLLLVSGVLDCSDGELARLTFAESRLGHWLDITGDTVVHLALLGGIAFRLAATGTMPGWPVLALLALGVSGAFVVITWSENTEDRRRRVAAWENRVLDGVLSPLTTRDWYVFVLGFALAGRLDLMVPAAAVGAQVFWLLALMLLIRVLARS